MDFVNSWLQEQAARLRTPRGFGASAIAVFSVLGALSGGGVDLGAILTVIAVAPVLWLVSWWLAGVGAEVWERLVQGGPPNVAVGRLIQATTSRQQLREDGKARFFSDRGGILLRRRVWFMATGTPPLRLDRGAVAAAGSLQHDRPQCVAGYADRRYWWYRDAFYWSNRAELSGDDVKALLFARERQRERELEHAHAVMAAASAPVARKRESIPRDVKLVVWKRDQGACTECQGTFDLQYDHVIPFSMGGANTVENLQLLCARCNRRKGGRL